jgi:NhaA family Na+:H+ antiporter
MMAMYSKIKVFKQFFQSPSSAGILLIVCVAVSLTIANTNFSQAFINLLNQPLGFNTTKINLEYSALTWINDGLMAVFFLLVGLEIKREIVKGQLSTLRNASLPVFAAIGGVAVPALIYYLLNNTNPQTSQGWGIPMATDIAFALGILSLLGNKVPWGLRIFLAALAIVDDLIAILIIAVFYSSELHFDYLAIAFILFVVLLVLNKLKISNLLFYLVPGLLMWYCIHHSGIHATIAGVLTAFAIPLTIIGKNSPLEKLEHALTNPVNFFIMPLFAIANTNITFNAGMIQELSSTLSLGIILGLILGKPLGIFIMSWFSVKAKISNLPNNTTWVHIAGLGLLGGIGFTMSIFIAMLSFNDLAHQTEAKFAILCASIFSGIAGFATLYIYAKRNNKL